jgi:hypothetical protein
MSIQQIGFDQGPQGLERSRERIDWPTSHATAGRQSENANDDSGERAGIAKSTLEFNRLTAQTDRPYTVAASIRTMDQTMETVGTTVYAMKKELEVVLKNYPPFPPGSQERVKQLRRFAGLRTMIDRLTVPSDKSSQQDADQKNAVALPLDKYSFVITSNGMTKTVLKEDIHVGPSGIYIPQLSPSEEVDDMAIKQAIGQLDQASEAIQARREALRAQSFAIGGSAYDRQMSEQSAEQASVQLGQDLAAQPVGIARESTTQLDQLMGNTWP